MKMRCPDAEKPIFCALTSGHTFVVGHEPIEVPRVFQGQALDAGALVVGLEGEARAVPVLDAPVEPDAPAKPGKQVREEIRSRLS